MPAGLLKSDSASNKIEELMEREGKERALLSRARRAQYNTKRIVAGGPRAYFSLCIGARYSSWDMFHGITVSYCVMVNYFISYKVEIIPIKKLFSLN